MPEIHEIIIKSRKDQLQDAAAEYKRKIQEMQDASKRFTSDRLTGNKLEIEQAKRVTAQVIAEEKIRTRAILDEMARRKKEQMNAAKVESKFTGQSVMLGSKESITQMRSYLNTLPPLSAEYDRMNTKLRETIALHPKAFSPKQMVSMTRDLTIIGFGIRGIVQDIKSLGDENQTFGDMALSISGITLQAAALTPIMLSLTQKMVNAGIVSASTLAALKGFTIGLASVAGGSAAVISAFGLMVGSVSNAGDMFSRLGSVLSGNMSYWDALKENIRDNTWGLIDFTEAVDATEDPLLTAVKNMNYLTSAAHYQSEAFRNLKSDVNNAVSVIQSKYALFVQGKHLIGEPVEGEMMGPPLPPKKEKTRTGGVSPRVQTEGEILSLVAEQQKQLEKLHAQLLINQGDYGAELDIRKKILEVENEIFRLRTGIDLNMPFKFAPKTIPESDLNIRRYTGINPNAPSPFNMGAKPVSEQVAAAMDELAQKQLAADQQSLSFAQEFVGLFGQLPAIADKILNIFFSIAQGLMSGGSGGGFFGFLGNALMGAAMGGGAIGLGGGGGIGGGGAVPGWGNLSPVSGAGGGDNIILNIPAISEPGLYKVTKKGLALVGARS
jgi:hypothetical protein